MDFKFDLQLFGGVISGLFGGGGGGGSVSAPAPKASAPGSVAVQSVDDATKESRSRIRRRVMGRDATNVTQGALSPAATGAAAMAKRLLGE